MSQSEPTNQNPLQANLAMGEDFLPSLYRTTLIIGMLITTGIIVVMKSVVISGSFVFGVVVALAFLKSQEIFLRRILQSRLVNPTVKTTKTPKTLWAVMIGKYFILAGIMALALHFEVLHLIAFIFGFALLHAVMLFKIVGKRLAIPQAEESAGSARHIS